MNTRNQVFLDPSFRDPVLECWRVLFRGEVLPAEWNSRGAAQAHLDGLLSQPRRKPALAALITPDVDDGRLPFRDGMGTFFLGSLTDPVTGRRVVTCEACASPVWFAPSAGCVVSCLCSRCESFCAVCEEELKEGTNIDAGTTPDAAFDGRRVCNECYMTGAAEEAAR